MFIWQTDIFNALLFPVSFNVQYGVNSIDYGGLKCNVRSFFNPKILLGPVEIRHLHWEDWRNLGVAQTVCKLRAGFPEVCNDLFPVMILRSAENETTILWFEFIDRFVVNSINVGVRDVADVHPSRIHHKDFVFRTKKEMDEVVGALKAVELWVVDDVFVVGNEGTKYVSWVN